MSETTAVATTTGDVGTELEQIRAQGKALVGREKELAKVARMLEGLQWGDVAGTSLSAHARYALAEFCYVTGANPHTHIDILGGRPYLNAHYWQDLLNASPHFIGYDQSNVSYNVEKLLRQQAEEAKRDVEELLADATRLGDESFREAAVGARRESLRLLEQAREMARQRTEWGAPTDEKSEVIVTVVRRYAPRAPLDQIVQGEIDGAPFVQEITECNWCGNRDRDPVGNKEVAKTARTRSLRRTAEKGFSAYLEGKRQQIERAEKIIEAEWEEIRTDRAAARAALPSPIGPQAVRTGGEPGAANPAGAAPLPVEDLTETAPASTTAAPAAQLQTTPTFDVTDARKRFFATLRDAGIQGDARKEWAKANGLPESTQEWAQAQWERAIETLVAPTRTKYLEGCSVLGVDPAAFAVETIGHPADTLRDYLQLLSAVNARVDRNDDGDEQRGLL